MVVKSTADKSIFAKSTVVKSTAAQSIVAQSIVAGMRGDAHCTAYCDTRYRDAPRLQSQVGAVILGSPTVRLNKPALT